MLPKLVLLCLFERMVFKHSLISIPFGLPITLSNDHGTHLNIKKKNQRAGINSLYW